MPGKSFFPEKVQMRYNRKRCVIIGGIVFDYGLAKRFMYFTFPEFALIIGDMETKLRILYSDRKQSWRNEQC